MKFNKNKYKVLRVGKHNPGVQHWLRFTWLENSSVEKDLRDLKMQLDNNLSTVSSVLLLCQRSQESAGLQNNNENIYETTLNSRIVLYITLIKWKMDLL